MDIVLYILSHIVHMVPSNTFVDTLNGQAWLGFEDALHDVIRVMIGA